ncbi:hypothetical protein FOVG_19371 [Fusarium oxysporum f. sp. pisi HDV247]|uniref:Uncharacterized protein n=1 Tax=Fusarium oxysporum f. sp. pisi HDV247 TaxID=1080344 RepID=W9NGG9_FUSOX|nr:hypothetical protein FOVG_19371 [Fusarium oxysporum f. sp. pisi HDV247]
MVTESSQRHRELLQNMHDVSADSIVCSGITVREHHQLEPWGMVGMDLPRPDQAIVSRRAATEPALFEWSRTIYCDNGSPFVNMKLRMAADRQGIKMKLDPDLSSFLYWFARTCRPPVPAVMINLNSRYIESIGVFLAMAMLGWLSFAKHSDILDPLPDEENTSTRHY